MSNMKRNWNMRGIPIFIFPPGKTATGRQLKCIDSLRRVSTVLASSFFLSTCRRFPQLFGRYGKVDRVGDIWVAHSVVHFFFAFRGGTRRQRALSGKADVAGIRPVSLRRTRAGGQVP